MNYIKYIIIGFLIYIGFGLFLTLISGEKNFNFKKYTKDDWYNLIIDMIIGFPLILKIFFNNIFVLIKTITIFIYKAVKW